MPAEAFPETHNSVGIFFWPVVGARMLATTKRMIRKGRGAHDISRADDGALMELISLRDSRPSNWRLKTVDFGRFQVKWTPGPDRGGYPESNG